MLMSAIKDVIQLLTPVRLVNRTERLYIAVLSEDGNGVLVLRPGEWTYPRIYGIDGFAAYAETNGRMQLANTHDVRGVVSVAWKLSNRVGNGNYSVRRQGNLYRIDRSGIPWGELDGNEQRYFSGLLQYRNMTLNEMLHREHVATATSQAHVV